jgi:glucosamine--fructose-6-phosphate aminotransferase (isomerizing)
MKHKKVPTFAAQGIELYTCCRYLNAGREHAVASTKAFTTQVTAMSLIAVWFAQQRMLASESTHLLNAKCNELVECIHRLPIYAGMALKAYPKCQAVAEKLGTAEHIFILGKGFGEPIAREGTILGNML